MLDGGRGLKGAWMEAGCQGRLKGRDEGGKGGVAQCSRYVVLSDFMQCGICEAGRVLVRACLYVRACLRLACSSVSSLYLCLSLTNSLSHSLTLTDFPSLFIPFVSP